MGHVLEVSLLFHSLTHCPSPLLAPGALLMEALVRHDLFTTPGLPKLRSMCLCGP